MTLAFEFLTPWLLVGVLAAAIPFILHLLSSVRARDVFFPTLRFLRLSMEKTARRRRLQHWLLLILRAALLALLAITVARPFTEAMGGWFGQEDYSTVVVLDNSYSMGASTGSGTRFDQAKAQAQSLLTGENRPKSGAVLLTNGKSPAGELTGDESALGRAVKEAPLSAGRAAVLQKIRRAAALLDAEDTVRQKSIYVFTDLQRVSFEEIARSEKLIGDKDIHVMIVNSAPRPGNNVGISGVEVGGRRIVNDVIQVTATVVNSSPGDREVLVGLRLDGRLASAPRKITLAGAGRDGSIATVPFPAPAGRQAALRTGEVFLANDQSKPYADDLELDNVRRFCMTVGGRVKALIVRGRIADDASAATDASTLLRIATDPWRGREDAPWSIVPRIIDAVDFRPADLAKVDVMFATNVPEFTTAQAAGIEKFLQTGGTVMLFLGPDIRAESYNKTFSPSVLPGKILDAVGQVGPDAGAVGVATVDVTDPYLKGLFKERSDYLSPLVQRYYRLDRTGRGSTVLMGLANRDPLMLTKRVGRGRITLCATAASGQWSNFLGSGANVVVSLVIRACLLAPRSGGPPDSYLSGAQVLIHSKAPGSGGKSGKISLPVEEGGKRKIVPLKLNDSGQATFTDTQHVGLYRWQLADTGAAGTGATGVFAVNPNGIECDLGGYTPQKFRQALAKNGARRIYVGSTLAEVNAAAEVDAEPTEWWDVVCVIVILLLIVEVLVANRRQKETPAFVPLPNPASEA